MESEGYSHLKSANQGLHYSYRGGGQENLEVLSEGLGVGPGTGCNYKKKKDKRKKSNLIMYLMFSKRRWLKEWVGGRGGRIMYRRLENNSRFSLSFCLANKIFLFLYFCRIKHKRVKKFTRVWKRNK